MVQSINVLSLDLSSQTARASIVSVAGASLTLIERHEKRLSEVISPLQNSDASAESNFSLPNEIQELLTLVKTPWRSAVVTISTDQGLSINLNLPFRDTRQIQKILPLEVQDLIPFEINDFHLATTLVSAANDDGNGCDIKVDLTRKAFLQGLILSLQSTGVDPRIISFPANALSTLITLAPDYFKPNCALVWITDAGCTTVGVVGGSARTSRTLPSPNNSVATSEILKEIRLFISLIERRHAVTLEKVYIFGGQFPEHEIKEYLSREYEILTITDFLKNAEISNSEDLSSLLAYQAILPHSKTQANFRSGEFRFRPQLKELTLGVKSLLPYGLTFLVCALLALGTVYFSNLSKISTLQDALRERIKKTIPSFTAPAGQELSTIAALTQKIEDQLKDIGSLATLSPLEAFLEISQDLPDNIGLNINELSIRETKVVVKGTAPDYGSLDKIEQALKRKRETYCAISIKDNAAGARSTSVGFELTVQLC